MKERCRGIIFIGDKIVSMYREFEGRSFYTFPGGGMEEGETEEQCVVREVFEEFGIQVNPIRKLYTYNGKNGIEYFYLCEYISGVLGTGEGEEFQNDRKRGIYKPTLIDVCEIHNLPLMPPEVATQLVEDFKINGKSIRENCLKVN